LLHPIPERLYYPLHDLAPHWGVGDSDLRQWLAGGVMTAVHWLPLMSVIERNEDEEESERTEFLRHWEGYVRMSEHQCGRIFRQGWITLREFAALDGELKFRLPESSDDLVIDPDDLVILEAERKRMEAQFPGLANPLRARNEEPQPAAEPAAYAIDPTYRIVRVDERDYRFGETQARVLRLLSDAARKGEPWQSGKHLLRLAGSQSFSLSNLFKRHVVWRELVISNKRGFYRLNERFICQTAEPGISGKKNSSRSPVVDASP
jgi:hypothetical protein